MNSKPKLLILAAVFVLSTVFFWAAINKMLLPSRAAGEKRLSTFIYEDTIICNPQSTCSASVYMSSGPGEGISGVTGKMIYSDNLTFVSSIEPKGVLETELSVKDDPATHTVTFSYVSLKPDSQLQSGGPHRLAALSFKPNATGDGSLKLAEGSAWQAVGTVSFAVSPDTKETAVGISQEAPKAKACSLTADCDCDGEVNLLDFEKMRPGLVSEAPGTCDLDADGALDSRDYKVWRDKVFNTK